jgi:nucleoside-triphosphatase
LKLVLTGDPGCGKTTAVRRVVEALRGRVSMTGFVTEEIREGAHRVGFRGITLDGRTFDLAHSARSGEPRVGPYGVDVAAFEAGGLPSLMPSPDTALVVVDEIGKMECLSFKFRTAVEALLEHPVSLLATLPSTGVGFVKKIRQDPRVTLVTMSRASRDAIVDDLLRRLGRGGVRSGGRA